MDIQIRKYTTQSGFLIKKTSFILEARIAFSEAEKSDLTQSGMRTKNVLFVSNEDCGSKDGATFEIAILMRDQLQSVAFSSEAVARKYELELNENLDALSRLLGHTRQVTEPEHADYQGQDSIIA